MSVPGFVWDRLQDRTFAQFQSPMESVLWSTTGPPPPPPPMPAAPAGAASDGMSKMAVKFRTTPPEWYFHDEPSGVPPDVNAAPTGFYFVYGSLMDPSLLAEILDLDQEPIYRPAQIVGYRTGLWGQYPALCDGEIGQAVQGLVYEAMERKHAARLAQYETSAYRAAPVLIDFLDTKQPTQARGWSFLYNGRPNELSDGIFDLKTWLRQIGRGKAADQLDVQLHSHVEAH